MARRIWLAAQVVDRNLPVCTWVDDRDRMDWDSPRRLYEVRRVWAASDDRVGFSIQGALC